jgi:uncharacterized membrane protein YbjE (DUF340 family)
MNTQTILNIALTVHLISLTLAVGITVANAVAFPQFWKLYDKNKEQGLSAFEGIAKFQLVGIIGLLLLILSGITMLWVFHWTLGEQLWFRIKMILVLLLFVNGFTLGRTTTLKLRKLLKRKKDDNDAKPQTNRLRKNLQIFNLTQLSIFIVIIILAVFRFN